MHKRKTIFTNGCFYLITPRHIALIKKIREIFPEDKYKLVVAVNDNEYTILDKGYPFILTNEQRKFIIENIKGVDEVIIFKEATPENLIYKLKPEFIIKGIDYYNRDVSGYKYSKNGLVLIKLEKELYNINTKDIVDKLKSF